ncbi:unnamed protein product [Prorocentrum cordatum]|nr:unnamed protein product [Polarella glacialis]
MAVSGVPSVAAHFATPIYRRRLHNAREVEELNSEIMVEAQQLVSFDERGLRWSGKNYPGGYTSFASMGRLHKFSSTFSKLERWANHHVRSFAKYLEFDALDDLVMTECWINIMPEGTHHGLHLHQCSTLSGTYYVETPRGCSGIRFEDPRLDRTMAAPPRAHSARRSNRQVVEYPARAGEVILWESWLRHQVQPNRGEGDRVSVSFNYHWC